MLSQPTHPCARGARPSAVEGSSGSEPGEEPHPRAYRACVRRPGDRAGRPAVAHHRHRAGADQDRLAELRLQRSPAGDARTQEVSLVQIGEPTGCRLRPEPARRGEKSRRQAANMRRYTNRCNVRSPIFDEIRHESEVSRRSHRESVILRGPLKQFFRKPPRGNLALRSTVRQPTTIWSGQLATTSATSAPAGASAWAPSPESPPHTS